jgi:poly-gamma-glutamate synthesis protein (capsule biosynthesis protein)
MLYGQAKLKIIIGGDTCPIGSNERLFQKGDCASLLNDLMPEFERADLAIVNLECPLIREESPIEKVGPNLGVSVDCVNALKAMDIDVVGLANNHIMDHGPQGLRTTIEALDEHGIAHVGAGENLDEARKILVREVNGIQIGILAVAEHEFCIATKESPGANPLDVIDYVRNINEYRSEFDKLIVLVHGGNEHYPYPRPRLMDTCRFYVEQGASAVICQHSHCTGCMEIHAGAPIVYGQGNFLFDMSSQYPTWLEGCLVHLTTERTGHCEVRMIPFRRADGGPGAHRMSPDEETNWRSAFDERSRHLANPQMVEEKWRAFCYKHKRNYLHTLHGKPSFLRRVAGKLNLLYILDGPEKQRARLNIIRCESHAEALITVLSREVER